MAKRHTALIVLCLMADSEQHPQDQQDQQTERADPIGAESPAPAAQPEHTTQVPGLSSAPGRPVASSPLRRLTDRLTTMFSPPRKKVVERRHTVETHQRISEDGLSGSARPDTEPTGR
ncbi:hypothetical protein FJT64_018019 [Amphibalanus amphitrite]|uniref:Uncharacterized protein n=1 Tax=Amphibalanus amphitrite TaxID=1232801 RepID=A0A6A4WYW8_AMPAM|nr:hypothetical protein FJT64_018019 [Amphibalanus amphitrite]